MASVADGLAVDQAKWLNVADMLTKMSCQGSDFE